LVLLRLFFVELWANTRQTDDVRSLTFEVTAHVGDAGHGRPTPSVYQVWSSYAFSFRRDGTFSVSLLIGLMVLNSQWGHASPVWRSTHSTAAQWASLLPMFSLLWLHRRSLRARHGTDRQTDRRPDRQRSSLHNAPPYGGGGINNFKYA